MSIERWGYGNYEVTCDQCGDSEDYTVFEGWPELMEEMKADGWRSRKVGKDWQHICDACQHPEE